MVYGRVKWVTPTLHRARPICTHGFETDMGPKIESCDNVGACLSFSRPSYLIFISYVLNYDFYVLILDDIQYSYGIYVPFLVQNKL